MILRYRLTDEDRERLGITDEWVSFDAKNLMLSDAEALEDAGYEADAYLEDIFGYEVFKDGVMVMEPVVDDDGNPTVDDDGNPVLAAKRRYPLRATRASVWLAARKSGCTVSYDKFDFSIVGLRSEAVPEGKAQGSDPVSEN